jgi:ATP-dependent DNA helicase RecG
MFDDYIVVESSGRLSGLVRADNIRSTHFSRNSKIAEFLKNYKFTKEFSEGVNRMCNELEQVGYSDEKLTIGSEKPTFEKIKMAFGNQTYNGSTKK